LTTHVHELFDQLSGDRLFLGVADDPERRKQQHPNGEVPSTAAVLPVVRLDMTAIATCASRHAALEGRAALLAANRKPLLNPAGAGLATAPNHGKHWTDAGRAAVQHLAQAGKSPEEIAAAMGRTAGAIAYFLPPEHTRPLGAAALRERTRAVASSPLVQHPAKVSEAMERTRAAMRAKPNDPGACRPHKADAFLVHVKLAEPVTLAFRQARGRPRRIINSGAKLRFRWWRATRTRHLRSAESGAPRRGHDGRIRPASPPRHPLVQPLKGVLALDARSRDQVRAAAVSADARVVVVSGVLETHHAGRVEAAQGHLEQVHQRGAIDLLAADPDALGRFILERAAGDAEVRAARPAGEVVLRRDPPVDLAHLLGREEDAEEALAIDLLVGDVLHQR